MYSHGQQPSGYAINPFFQESVRFNFDMQSYFSGLEYIMSSRAQPSLNYRMSSYISLFSPALLPVYVGVSSIERYIMRNALKMQVDLEYSSNRKSGIDDIAQMQDISYIIPHTSFIIHDPGLFLSGNRPHIDFIDTLTANLKSKISQAFRLTAGFEMPENILISVLDEASLEREHKKIAGNWSRNILGFAVNRAPYDASQIFVKKSQLDSLMLTIGHEIGHCLTPPLDDLIAEEQKAFAFEIAWANTLHKFDILGLRDYINPNPPAENGIHNKAFTNVKKALCEEKDPMSLFWKIAKGEMNNF